MKMEFELDHKTLDRWVLYADENPAWTLDDFLTQLMRHHFDEADAMKASIINQERRQEQEQE